jgi:hypothetical protein
MSESRIAVRFVVPLTGDGTTGDSGPLIFTRWLPIGQERGLTFTHGCSDSLWFEPSSTSWNADRRDFSGVVGVNRLPSYVRIEKGQHWVRPMTLDPGLLASHASRMHAKARPGDGDWFVSRRPSLALELLAGAENIASGGNDRVALTEAVSALEVALARFARSAKLKW